MISIIIPTATNPEGLENLLKSIILYTDHQLINKIFVIVNTDTDSEKQKYLICQNTIQNTIQNTLVEFVWVDKKIGFARAVNIGINKSYDDDIVLLNDDCILLDQPKNKWIQLLLDSIKIDGTGICAPMTSFVGEIEYALFFCVYIKREVTEKIGALDESLWGYYEDMDFCIRANIEGYKTIQVCPSNNYKDGQLVGGFPIYHEGGKTHKKIKGIDEHIASNYNKVTSKYSELLRKEKQYDNDALSFFVGARLYSSTLTRIKITPATKIEGYMTDKELVALSIIASSSKIFIEIGSWLGRSSNAIAESVKGVLFCIDTWNGTENEGDNHSQARGLDGDYAFRCFIRNNQKHIINNKIIPLRMNSENGLSVISELNIEPDVIFIDADHSYEAVKKDINMAKKTIKNGGFICGHDYSNDWKGVKKAVSDSFSEYFIIEGTTIWIAKYENSDNPSN